MTPPGSPCSVIFGTGITPAAPGSAEGLQLVANAQYMVDEQAGPPGPAGLRAST